MPRLRADVLLVERGLCESREQARRLILAGQVRRGPDQVVRKASELLAADAPLVVDAGDPYVSRAAGKLLPALDAWLPDLSGLIALDIGASTGGFTDLMLQRGAAKVHAVDVGHGQLHARLRGDPRVTVHEGVNARLLTPDFLDAPVDVVTVDVSFISTTLILPAVAPLLRPGGHAFVLVKPQFEAGRGEVGKGGVVRDDAVRQACLDKVVACAQGPCGWACLGHLDSPVPGPKGNREIVAAFRSAP
jgi:23S rRNA (cytidine1920-2'-O)/16S rRNA (cytidine1409-2'-O)-methyltransferase